MAMSLVSTVTVGSGGAASMEFTNIVGTGKDLLLLVSARRDSSSGNSSVASLRFNGSTSGYTSRYLYGDGSSRFSASTSTNQLLLGEGTIPNETWTADTIGSLGIYIPNYAGATNKTISCDAVSEHNITEAYQNIVAGQWANTAAITSISFFLQSGGTINQFSTASLYIIS